MRQKIALTCIAVFVVGTSLQWVQAQSVGPIRGEVKDEQGNPIKDVEIRIQAQKGKRGYKTKTNKKGEYYYGSVSLQFTYRVIAEKEGYRTEFEQHVKAGFGSGDNFGDRHQGPREEVNFVLTEGKSGKLDFEMTPEEREKILKQQTVQADVQKAFQQGSMAHNLGQFEDAVAAFKKALEKDPARANIWARLGNSYLELKDFDHAIESYEAAIEFDPENGGFYQNLGGIYTKKGDTKKAQEMYEKSASFATNPRIAAANHYNAAVVNINSGNSKAARASLEKAIEADPTHEEAHYQLGIILLGMNLIDDAVNHLGEYGKLAPKGPNAEVAASLVEQLSQK